MPTTTEMPDLISEAQTTEEAFLRQIFVRDQMAEWSKHPLVMAKADDIFYWDVHGKRYHDAISGIYVASVCHNHRRVIEAIRRQYEVLAFSPPMHGTNPLAVQLANLLAELDRIGLAVDKDDPRLFRLLDEVKEREAIGYAYEAADASFELLARRLLGKVPRYFDVEKFDVSIEQRINAKGERVSVSLAVVKVKVGDGVLISAAEGNGPVNALDLALRKDLGKYQGYITGLELTDYRVRILNGGTGAVTRVLIESADETGYTGVDVHHRAAGEVDGTPDEHFAGVSHHRIERGLCGRLLGGVVARCAQSLGGGVDRIRTCPVPDHVRDREIDQGHP